MTHTNIWFININHCFKAYHIQHLLKNRNRSCECLNPSIVHRKQKNSKSKHVFPRSFVSWSICCFISYKISKNYNLNGFYSISQNILKWNSLRIQVESWFKTLEIMKHQNPREFFKGVFHQHDFTIHISNVLVKRVEYMMRHMASYMVYDKRKKLAIKRPL